MRFFINYISQINSTIVKYKKWDPCTLMYLQNFVLGTSKHIDLLFYGERVIFYFHHITEFVINIFFFSISQKFCLSSQNNVVLKSFW